MHRVDTSHPGRFTFVPAGPSRPGLPAHGPAPLGALDQTDGGEGASRKRKEAPASEPVARAGNGGNAAQRRRVEPTRVRLPEITPPLPARGTGADATPAYVRGAHRRSLAATEPLPGGHGDPGPTPFSPVRWRLDEAGALDPELEPGSPEHQRLHAAGSLAVTGPADSPETPPPMVRPSRRQTQASLSSARSQHPPEPAGPRPTPLSQQARRRRAVMPTPLSALRESEAEAGSEVAAPSVRLDIAPGYYTRTQFPGKLQARALALQADAVRRDYGGDTEAASLQALDDLVMAHRRAVPRGDDKQQAQTLDVLERLVTQNTSARELEDLITRGCRFDLGRTVPNSLLMYGASFLAAGYVQQALQAHLTAGEPALAGPCLEEPPIPTWVAASLAHLVSDLVIGVGGEMASAIWRESRLNRSYNSPMGHVGGNHTRFFDETWPGFFVQALSALPFAGAYIAHRLLPGAMGPAEWRPAWGAVAAATSGLGREALRQTLSWRVNPTWLGGPTPASRPFAPTPAAFELGTALECLRHASSALRDGTSDWFLGLRKTLGVPGAKALVQVLGRTFAALVARGGSLLAVAVERQDDPAWKAAADAWLGLSWGLLSTLPSRLGRWLGVELTQAAGISLGRRAADSSVSEISAASAASAPPVRAATPGATLAILPGPGASTSVLTPGGR